MRNKLLNIFLCFLVFGMIFSVGFGAADDPINEMTLKVNTAKNNLNQAKGNLKDAENRLNIEKVNQILDSLDYNYIDYTDVDDYNNHVNNCRDDPSSCSEAEVNSYGISSTYFATQLDNIANLQSKLDNANQNLLICKASAGNCNTQENEVKQFQEQLKSNIKYLDKFSLEDYSQLNSEQRAKARELGKDPQVLFNDRVKYINAAFATGKLKLDDRNRHLIVAQAQASGFFICKDKVSPVDCLSYDSSMYVYTPVCYSVDDPDCIQKILDKCEENHQQGCSEIESITRNSLQVQLNVFGSILSLLGSSDQNAQDALKLFGVKPNMKQVPSFLREDFPSTICMGKIKGYLDTQKTDSGGGVTEFGCDRSDGDGDVEFEYTDPNCNIVISDLRAQRTPMTPDGIISITYSSYIKAPTEDKIKYIIAILYKQNNRVKKKLVLNLTDVAKDSTDSRFEHFPLQINLSEGQINENTLTISLLAVFTDGSRTTRNKYTKVYAPITLIELTDTYNTLNYASGGSSSSSSRSRPITQVDLMDMIDFD